MLLISKESGVSDCLCTTAYAYAYYQAGKLPVVSPVSPARSQSNTTTDLMSLLKDTSAGQTLADSVTAARVRVVDVRRLRCHEAAR